MSGIPESLLKTWIGCINGYDLEHLLALYHEDAILIPTFSNHVLDTPGKIRKYFENLSSREELSLALHEKTLKVQSIRPQLHSVSGIYCWRFVIDEEMMNFEARFTFLMDFERSSPIILHHTSQLPRTL